MDSLKQLKQCKTAIEAIRCVLENCKQQNPRYSQRYFLRKLGVNSSGYLGDVLAGRRGLAKHHWALLMDAAHLDAPSREILKLLLQIDREKSPITRRELSADLEEKRAELF